MFTLIGNTIACIFWGIIISGVLTTLLFRIMKALCPSASLTFPSGLTLFILSIFLFAQSVMLTGAIYAKGYVKDIDKITGQTGDAGQIKQKISTEYPFVSSYLNPINVTDVSAISIIKEIKSLINYYIMRRILWMTGLMIAGMVVLRLCTPRTRRYDYDDYRDLE